MTSSIVRLDLENTRILSPRQLTLLRDIASVSETVHMPAYLVGGFVRDYFLERPVNDLDVVIVGDAITVGEALVQKFGGKLTTHTKFRTAIWHLPSSFLLPHSSLDLVTARSETYERAGVLPTIKPSTIDDDLRRRDFTINAMAVRLDGNYFGELLDPLNGQVDLEKRLIRVLHPHSFIDDPTRIFRAIRYEARYSFSIDPETLSLVNSDSLTLISKLSGERLRHEIDLILNETNSLQMLQCAGRLGLYKHIHPALPVFNENYADLLDSDTTIEVSAGRAEMGYLLWLINLTEESILSISQRLDFSSDMTYSIWAAAQLKKSLPFLVGSKPSTWVYALEKLPLHSIYVVYLITGERPLLNYISIWRHVKSHTTGEELKARGLPPGPRYAEILSALRAAWLDGDVTNNNEEEEFLKTLL